MSGCTWNDNDRDHKINIKNFSSQISLDKSHDRQNRRHHKRKYADMSSEEVVQYSSDLDKTSSPDTKVHEKSRSHKKKKEILEIIHHNNKVQKKSEQTKLTSFGETFNEFSKKQQKLNISKVAASVVKKVKLKKPVFRVLKYDKALIDSIGTDKPRDLDVK